MSKIYNYLMRGVSQIALLGHRSCTMHQWPYNGQSSFQYDPFPSHVLHPPQLTHLFQLQVQLQAVLYQLAMSVNNTIYFLYEDIMIEISFDNLTKIPLLWLEIKV